MPLNNLNFNSINTAFICFLGTKICFPRQITLFPWECPEISQDAESAEASSSFVKIWRDKGKDLGSGVYVL